MESGTLTAALENFVLETGYFFDLVAKSRRNIGPEFTINTETQASLATLSMGLFLVRPLSLRSG